MDINSSSLRIIILRCIAELGYQGYVSLSICEDICIHWKRDIGKLIDFHGHDHGIGLEKIVGYLSFWIRKLKPISDARPITIEDDVVKLIEEYQQSSINELVSIYIVKIFLSDYCDQKIEISTDVDQIEHYKKIKENLENNFSGFFSTFGTSEFKKSFLYSCLYDMRYRTFGPHHVVHAVRYFLTGVDMKLLNKSFGPNDVFFTSRKKIVLMQVFISAPGDVQKNKLKPLNGSDEGQIAKIINKNFKKWLKLHNVAVVPVSQSDFESRFSGKSAQYEILRQLYDEKLMDVYCGIIDSSFGSPIDGVGSGTIAEYEFAKRELHPDLIMFGKNETPTIDINKKEDLQNALNIKDFFGKEGSDGLLYWSYQEDKSYSNFEQKFIDQLDRKIETYKKNYN